MLEQTKQILKLEIEIAQKKVELAHLNVAILATQCSIQENIEELAKELENKSEGFAERCQKLVEEIKGTEQGIVRLKSFQLQTQIKIDALEIEKKAFYGEPSKELSKDEKIEIHGVNAAGPFIGLAKCPHFDKCQQKIDPQEEECCKPCY